MFGTRGRAALVFVNVSAAGALLIGWDSSTRPADVPPDVHVQIAHTAGTTPTPADEVVTLTNAERAKAGCPGLQVDARLTAAAQLHSEDMSANNYFSHTSQDGRTFVDRIKAQGYPSPGAENIAKGYRTAADVMAGWLGSDGHRRNILNCSLRAIGVGLAPGNVWTQDFGFTAAAAPPTTSPAPTTTPPTTTAPTTTAPTTTTPTTTTTTSRPPTTTTSTTTSSPSTTPPTTTTTPAGTQTGSAAEVVRITNAERAKAGCPALRVDARLTTAAQLHSADMSANSYFSHTSRDGRSFADRIRAQGYPTPAAENIARGQRSASAVMQAWLNSPGHRRNILNCSLRAIGVGFAPGNVWTQDFGRT